MVKYAVTFVKCKEREVKVMKKNLVNPVLTVSTKSYRHLSFKKAIAGTALALTMIGMTGCTESTESGANNTPPSSAADTSASSTSSESTVPDAPEQTNENENNTPSDSNSSYGVGETAESGDVQVTFLGVTESAGSEFNKPGDGNVFVLAEFEIANNGSEDLGISSMLSFEAYQDGYATEVSLSALMEADSQLDGNIASGKKMKGYVGYEVPSEYKELEINMQLDVWSDEKLVFVYTK